MTRVRVICFSNKEPDLRGQMLRGPFVGGPVDVVPTEDITFASCKVVFFKAGYENVFAPRQFASTCVSKSLSQSCSN